MNGKIGEVRPSQFITTFGPGAIMDLPDFSVIIAGLELWELTLCERIYDPRLTRMLGLGKLYSPPIPSRENHQGTLPAYRFPRFLVCPECRRLGQAGRPFQSDPETGIARCLCNKQSPVQVFPSRFIVACPRGHISDFPWFAYVHAKSSKRDCSGLHLYLNDRGATGSIADVEVECRECGSKRTMDDAFKHGRPDILGNCQGHRPWLGRNAQEHDCPEELQAMLRGASNAYFSIVASALSIPPYINPVHEIVSAELERLTRVNSLEKLSALMEDGVFPSLEHFTPQRVWDAILQQRNLKEGPDQDILFPEWGALLAGSNPGGPHEFETEDQQVPSYFNKWISRLVMVRRLTEVRVLSGFTRIDPPADITALLSGDEETRAKSTKAPLSREPLNWLPAMVTRGEGIFLSLNEHELRDWENRIAVEKATSSIKKAFQLYCTDREISPPPPFPGARYVLLHTLAHALMRQLCLNSGYSSTSLRERIYSRRKDGEDMAGILIYTATPDSEGSLGGLVELGKTHKFQEVLWAALQDAQFCSSDPLCAEHQPDAVGDLNGAACHACCLAPETSCEHSNRLLDRTFLVPTVSTTDVAFFK